MNWRGAAASIGVLVKRALNEITRVPGAAIPGVLAPTIFFLGLTSVFGSLTLLPGFTTSQLPELPDPGQPPAGSGLHRRGDGGQPRPGHRAGMVRPPARLPRSSTGAARRPGAVGEPSLPPPRDLPARSSASRSVCTGPGLLGLLIAITLVMGMAVVAATWGTSLALRFRTQAAAPIMQVGMLLAVLLTTAYAPQHLLTGWLQEVAKLNPVTQVVEAVRQGFVGSVSWSRHLARIPDALRARRGAQLLRPARHAPDDVLMAQRPLVADAEVRDTVMRIAQQTLRRELDRGRAGRRPLRLLAAEPGSLPVAVVLGLLLPRDRLAPVRPATAPSRSSAACSTAGAADGFIGHTIFWDRPVDWKRRWTYNVTSRSARNTSTIQPPLLAWAWKIAVGDPAEERRIAAHHRWLEANRDLDGDGLLWIVQPDESGLDSSPKFDAVWGRHAHGHPLFPAPDREEPPARLGRAPGARRGRTGALRGGHQRPLVPRPDRGRRALDHARADRSRSGTSAAGSSSTSPAGRSRRSDDTDPIGGDHRIRVSTWSALAPLALPDLPGGDRQAPGRGAPARPAQVLAALPAHLRLGARSPASSRADGSGRCAASTGAARPGSTRPG